MVGGGTCAISGAQEQGLELLTGYRYGLLGCAGLGASLRIMSRRTSVKVRYASRVSLPKTQGPVRVLM